jgi:flagellin-specific chaperone FliS
MVNQEEIDLLSQLISSIYESTGALEEAYLKKDLENINKIKRVILELQFKIANALK